MFMLNNNPIHLDAPLVIDGYQYPAGYFRRRSEARATVGITEVADQPRPDDRYNFVTQNPDGTYTATPKPASMFKPQKLAEINGAYTQAMQVVKEGYPEDEIKTWPKQEAQARATIADPNASTPFLDWLCLERGVDKATIAARIMEKVDVYEMVSGTLTGKRQRLEDQILAIQDDTPAEEAGFDNIQWAERPQ